VTALPEVVCVGAATIDTIALVDGLPGPDERIVADEIVTAGGGPAATAAVTLARLGVAVGFCGVVGDDDDGRTLRAGLEAEGVDVRWLRTERGVRTARSIVLVQRESGARAIVTTGGARPDAAAVPADVGWLHADQSGYAAVRAARRHGARVSLDDGNAVDDLDLRAVDLYAPTASVLAARFGDDLEDALRAARAAGAGAVVATAGADGAYHLDGDAVAHTAAVPADVVSTLGAGDVFHGALLAALVNGAPLGDAVASASWVAAASTRALDGRAAIPHATDLPRRFAVREGTPAP